MDLFQLTWPLLTLGFVLTALLGLWYVYKQIQFHVWKLPPGPLTFPYPFFGYVGKDPLKAYDSLSKKYGPLFSLVVGSFNAVVVSDFEYAKELLSHPAALARPEGIFNFVPSNAGFGGINSAAWQEQRRFCVHALRVSRNNGRTWEKIIQESVSEFADHLQKEDGKPTHISGMLTRFVACDVVELLTGQRFTQRETNPDARTLERANHAALAFLDLKNVVVVVPGLFKYFVKFNVAGLAEKLKLVENAADIMRRQITRYQESTDDSKPMDIVGLYLEALKKESMNDKKSSFSVANLEGNLAVLSFAGSDTAVASVHWLLVLMAAYPEVQRKVQGEIDDVIGRDAQTAWNDRQRLPYTMATICEMQRWAALAPLLVPRCASETFAFHGYVIPKGTMIICNSWTMHRDPKYWDNPDEFLPERFLQKTEKSMKGSLNMPGFAPFSFGKRKCPGETTGNMTTFLYFTEMMRRFKIKAPPGYQVDTNPEFGAVMHPKSQGLCFIRR